MGCGQSLPVHPDRGQDIQRIPDYKHGGSGRHDAQKDRTRRYRANAGAYDRYDYHERNAQGRTVREQDNASAQQQRRVQNGEGGGVARPKQAKLKQPRKRGHHDRNKVEEYEMQERHARASKQGTSKQPAHDGFAQTAVSGTRADRLSKPNDQSEMHRADSTKQAARAERLSKPFQQDEVFVVGDDSPPPSPYEERRHTEQEWESRAVQYQWQPGVKMSMMYPSVMDGHAFTDDGQVSPLEEEFAHGPLHRLRKAAITSAKPGRHVSQKGEMDWIDNGDSLSNWSGSTKQNEHFEDIDLHDPSSEASLRDTARFDDAYKNLTDRSETEGGRAVKYAPRDDGLWFM